MRTPLNTTNSLFPSLSNTHWCFAAHWSSALPSSADPILSKIKQAIHGQKAKGCLKEIECPVSLGAVENLDQSQKSEGASSNARHRLGVDSKRQPFSQPRPKRRS